MRPALLFATLALALAATPARAADRGWTFGAGMYVGNLVGDPNALSAGGGASIVARRPIDDAWGLELHGDLFVMPAVGFLPGLGVGLGARAYRTFFGHLDVGVAADALAYAGAPEVKGIDTLVGPHVGLRFGPAALFAQTLVSTGLGRSPAGESFDALRLGGSVSF